MIHVGRLTDKIINRIKQLINLGYKDYQIVEDVGVSRQTVAKYRRVVLEEAREKARAETAARVEEERRRREEREKKIRDHQTGLARAHALKRQEEEEEEAQAEEERLQRVRIQRQIQERAEERERQEKANKELQAYFVKAEADDKARFMQTYNLLYALNEEAALKGTKKHFTKILEWFDFPFSKFVYTAEERTGLPLMLLDRGSMDTALKMGFWPYKRDPLIELIDGLKSLNEPQKPAPVDPDILLEIIKREPFIFLYLGRTG